MSSSHKIEINIKKERNKYEQTILEFIKFINSSLIRKGEKKTKIKVYRNIEQPF